MKKQSLDSISIAITAFFAGEEDHPASCQEPCARGCRKLSVRLLGLRIRLSRTDRLIRTYMAILECFVRVALKSDLISDIIAVIRDGLSAFFQKTVLEQAISGTCKNQWAYSVQYSTASSIWRFPYLLMFSIAGLSEHAHLLYIHIAEQVLQLFAYGSAYRSSRPGSLWRHARHGAS